MNQYLEQILKNKKITDYLLSKGCDIQKTSPGRIWYKCPVHAGDNTPSFCVYTDSEIENYYCHGCHSGGTLIQLYMDVEESSFASTIKSLGEGIDFDSSFDLKTYIKSLRETDVFSEVLNQIDDVAFRIYRTCYDSIELCDFNKQEIEFYEKVYKIIDELYIKKDVKTLVYLESALMDVYIPSRTERYLDKKEATEVKSLL